MSTSTNVGYDSKVKSGSKVLLWGVTISLVSLFIVAVSCYLFYYSYSAKAASVFEEAYEKIEEFDKQTNVYSKQELEKQIIPLLDEVVANYTFSGSYKRSLYYKAYVQYYTENYSEALKSFTFFVSKFSNDNLTYKSYYFIAYCYENLEKIDDAIKALKIFDDKLSDVYFTSLAYYKLGLLYEKKGDNKSALNYYQKIVRSKEDSSQKENAKRKIAILKNDIKI